VGWPRKRKNKKKGGRRKSQNRNISPQCGGATVQQICTKFGEVVDLRPTDVITPAKFGSKISIGFPAGREVEKAFSF